MLWRENHVQNINCLQAATHRFEGNKMQLKLGLPCWFCFLSLENQKLQGTDLLFFKNTVSSSIIKCDCEEQQNHISPELLLVLPIPLN